MQTKFFFANEKCHVRPSVAMNAFLNRSSWNFHKRRFAMWLNSWEVLRRFQKGWRHLWIGRPRPPKMAVFATSGGWAVFNEYAEYKPVLLRCVQHIHRASSKSSGSFQVGLQDVQYAPKVELKFTWILAVNFVFLMSAVRLILRFSKWNC